jgi:hypothetical protein
MSLTPFKSRAHRRLGKPEKTVRKCAGSSNGWINLLSKDHRRPFCQSSDLIRVTPLRLFSGLLWREVANICKVGEEVESARCKSSLPSVSVTGVFRFICPGKATPRGSSVYSSSLSRQTGYWNAEIAFSRRWACTELHKVLYALAEYKQYFLLARNNFGSSALAICLAIKISDSVILRFNISHNTGQFNPHHRIHNLFLCENYSSFPPFKLLF